MLKKFVMTGALLAMGTGIAFADPIPAPYVGASLGITTNTSSVKVTSPSTNYFGGSYRGIPFNLFVGYGGIITQCFYLAGEGFGTVGTFDISDKNGLKTSYGYGIALIPGVMLSDHTLAYLRGGVLRANFSAPNEMRTGGQFGLGLQTTITQNVDLRLEYDYVAYTSTSKTLNATNVSVSPRADQFTLGLLYKFD